MKFSYLIRWLLGLSVAFFTMALIIPGILFSSASSLVTDPESVKGFLDEGEVYELLTEASLDHIYEQAGRETVVQLTGGISDEERSELVKNIFPKEWLQTNTEKVIDATYAWLNGETEQPDFVIDIAERKSEITDAVALITKNNALAQRLLDDPNFLSDVRFDASEKMQLSPQELKEAQRAFQLFKYFTLVFFFLVVLAMALIYLILPFRKSGLRVGAMTLFVPACIVTLFSLLTKNAFQDWFPELIADLPPDQQEFVVELLPKTLELGFVEFSSRVALHGYVLLMISFFMVLLSIKVPNQEWK